ncbi:MAG: hypothetical protein RLZZ386_692 [Planctomycetota bacterium]
MTSQRTIVRLLLLCAMPVSCVAPAGKVETPPILFEILSTTSVPFAVDASDQIASMGANWTWQLVDANGRATGDPVIQSIAVSTELHGGMWMVPMIDGDREFLRRGSDGELLLVAVEAPNNKAISIFTPALILAPRQMHMDEIFASSSSMRVDWMDDGGERDRGVGERTTRIVRAERIRTPLGEFQTMRVETKFEAVLSLAKAQRSTTVWIAAGIGPIAEEWRARVTVMGIQISNDLGTAIRISTISPTQGKTIPLE